VLCLLGLAVAVDQYAHGYLYAALGLVLLSGPMLFFLGKLFLTNVARTSAGLEVYSFFIVLGTLVLGFAFYTNDAETMSGIGFLNGLLWFVYLKWYSVFPERLSPRLEVGKYLPILKFEDADGQTVSSETLLGKKNILMFYRGNWCPLCVAQIKELADAYKALESQGIQTVLISPQPHSRTRKIANKYDVGFKYLIDKDSSVAKQLNIFAKNGLPAGMQILGYDSDTVMPTVILTDEKGLIVYTDLTSNYRVRPEPGDLMNYFK